MSRLDSGNFGIFKPDTFHLNIDNWVKWALKISQNDTDMAYHFYNFWIENGLFYFLRGQNRRREVSWIFMNSLKIDRFFREFEIGRWKKSAGEKKEFN